MNICHDKTFTCVYCGQEYRATTKMQRWKYRVCSVECGFDYVKREEVTASQNRRADNTRPNNAKRLAP